MKHPLEPPGVVIGRGSEADLRVSDPGVSRRHVEIRVRPDEEDVVVTVVDLGSTNGTRVNGKRIQHVTIDDGAQIEIGSTRMTVRSPRGAEPGPAQSPGMDRPARPKSRPPETRSPSSDWPR
jgi:pSer/pThr/pTyr-binding forkhead associated (FHA) protein